MQLVGTLQKQTKTKRKLNGKENISFSFWMECNNIRLKDKETYIGWNKEWSLDELSQKYKEYLESV